MAKPKVPVLGKGHVRNTSGRNSDKVIKERRAVIQQIINDLHKEGKPIRPKILHEKLKEKGFVIDTVTLYFDRKFLAENNSWVRDIAESNYSQMIEDHHTNVSYIRDQAMDLAEKSWSKSKAKRKIAGETTTTETELIEDEANPRERFYRLALDCEKQLLELLKGDVLNYSVAFLQKKLQSYKAEIERLQQVTGKKSLIKLQ